LKPWLTLSAILVIFSSMQCSAIMTLIGLPRWPKNHLDLAICLLGMPT
jgi:hypothetical protein